MDLEEAIMDLCLDLRQNKLQRLPGASPLALETVTEHLENCVATLVLFCFVACCRQNLKY